MRARTAACLLTGLLAATALLAAGQAAAASVEVHLHNAAFSPAAITVQPNDTVTWFNDDSFDHDVTFDAGFSSGGAASLKAGQNWSHQFTTAGTFGYKCTVHTGMVGTVTVGAAAPAPPKTPGFELPAALAAVAAVALLARRRSSA